MSTPPPGSAYVGIHWLRPTLLSTSSFFPPSPLSLSLPSGPCSSHSLFLYCSSFILFARRPSIFSASCFTVQRRGRTRLGSPSFPGSIRGRGHCRPLVLLLLLPASCARHGTRFPSLFSLAPSFVLHACGANVCSFPPLFSLLFLSERRRPVPFSLIFTSSRREAPFKLAFLPVSLPSSSFLVFCASFC